MLNLLITIKPHKNYIAVHEQTIMFINENRHGTVGKVGITVSFFVLRITSEKLHIFKTVHNRDMASCNAYIIGFVIPQRIGTDTLSFVVHFRIFLKLTYIAVRFVPAVFAVNVIAVRMNDRWSQKIGNIGCGIIFKCIRINNIFRRGQIDVFLKINLIFWSIKPALFAYQHAFPAFNPSAVVVIGNIFRAVVFQFIGIQYCIFAFHADTGINICMFCISIILNMSPIQRNAIVDVNYQISPIGINNVKIVIVISGICIANRAFVWKYYVVIQYSNIGIYFSIVKHQVCINYYLCTFGLIRLLGLWKNI